jgi:hypothetical protein
MSEDPNSPKILATVPTDAEAAIIANYLVDQGIKSHIVPGSNYGSPDVIVRQADFARARELVALAQPTTSKYLRLD